MPRCCDRHYTPEPRSNGYPEEVRVQTVRLYLKGTNFRRIGCRRVSYEFSGTPGEETLANAEGSKPLPFIKSILKKSRYGETEQEEEVKFRHTVIAR
jgi:hypothetical protein